MFVLTELANSVPDTGDELQDETLVARIGSGEKALFTVLYNRYRSRTFALAFGMTGHREQADDLAQEIFLRTYQQLSTFQGRARFATWFYRLALNHCLNYCRRERGRKALTTSETQIPLLVELRPSEEVHEAILRQEIQQHIRIALLSLKPELRLLIVLKEIEGCTYEEIAERLECSAGTVASRLSRARKLLARKLESLKGNI